MQIPRLACSGDINSAISYAFKTLGYDRPTLEQERAILEFVSGRDIFVISPTGSGKSMCFVALPLVFDYIRSIFWVITFYSHYKFDWSR